MRRLLLDTAKTTRHLVRAVFHTFCIWATTELGQNLEGALATWRDAIYAAQWDGTPNHLNPAVTYFGMCFIHYCLEHMYSTYILPGYDHEQENDDPQPHTAIEDLPADGHNLTELAKWFKVHRRMKEQAELARTLSHCQVVEKWAHPDQPGEDGRKYFLIEFGGNGAYATEWAAFYRFLFEVMVPTWGGWVPGNGEGPPPLAAERSLIGAQRAQSHQNKGKGWQSWGGDQGKEAWEAQPEEWPKDPWAASAQKTWGSSDDGWGTQSQDGSYSGGQGNQAGRSDRRGWTSSWGRQKW